MRLWHQNLIQQLPIAQLNGQHRECCALRGNGWGKRHRTVDYVFLYNPVKLVAYHFLIMTEKQRRGHKGTDQQWLNPYYRGKGCSSWTKEALDQSYLQKNVTLIYKEHNHLYLQECLANLLNKGHHLYHVFNDKQYGNLTEKQNM